MKYCLAVSKGLFLQVRFLEHHDCVSLAPNPVLHLLPKEGDVAEGKLMVS